MSKALWMFHLKILAGILVLFFILQMIFPDLFNRIRHGNFLINFSVIIAGMMIYQWFTVRKVQQELKQPGKEP